MRTRHCRMATAATFGFVFLLILALHGAAQGQTFTVLHAFTCGGDQGGPAGTPILDAAGNLYGTTPYIGGNDNGTVYKLTHRGSGWVLTTLYTFSGGSDGGNPVGQLARDPNGILYGTTAYGGAYGEGTIFQLRPSPTAMAAAITPWRETVLHSFGNGNDGSFPVDLTIDPSGNLYGGTADGGGDSSCFGGCGAIYKLTPSSGQYQMLHSFSYAEGASLGLALVLDGVGNLYGTAPTGGAYGHGSVFELTPSGTLTLLHSFTGGSDGAWGMGVIFDPFGNLYGSSGTGGPADGGVAYEMSPSGSGWTYTPIYDIPGSHGYGAANRFVMDPAGNLYGNTAYGGLYSWGSIFKLSPGSGGWTYTTLHDFTGGDDGALASAAVVRDSSGNLYGTTEEGGTYHCGVIYEITP